MIRILGSPNRWSPVSKSLNRVVETIAIKASIVTINFPRMVKHLSHPIVVWKRNGPKLVLTGFLSYSGQLRAKIKINGLTIKICLNVNFSGIPPATKSAKGPTEKQNRILNEVRGSEMTSVVKTRTAMNFTLGSSRWIGES